MFRSVDATVRATLDSSYPVTFEDHIYESSIRTTECQVLTDSLVCFSCKAFRPVLHSMYSRWLRSSNKENVESKFTNNRYLHSPQKDAKLKKLQERAVVAEKERNALRAAVEELTRKNGVNVEPSFHHDQDLVSTMSENQDKIASQYPEGSFRRLFWEQQIKRSKQGAKQMRWHPTMIRYLMKKILETRQCMSRVCARSQQCRCAREWVWPYLCSVCMSFMSWHHMQCWDHTLIA